MKLLTKLPTNGEAKQCQSDTGREEETTEVRYIPCLDRNGNIYYLHPVTLEKVDRVTP